MRAIFVRHGESTGNAGVPCHDLATIELTQRGHEQARQVAASWTGAPALIVTSPYMRTGYAPKDGLPIGPFSQGLRGNSAIHVISVAPPFPFPMSDEAFWRSAIGNRSQESAPNGGC